MISTFRSRAGTFWENPQKGFVFLIVALAICVGVIVIWVTPWGPWTGSDSVVYLLSAKNLVDKGFLGIIWGQGSAQTLGHFPPLLTFVVAGLYLFGLDLVSAMRVICAVSFGLLILSVGLLSYKVTKLRSLAVQVCLILVTFPTVFRAYTSAMSEALFYLCMLNALLLILAYLGKRRVAYLAGSALFASAAILTRYIGVAILASCLMGNLIFSREAWKKRLYDALIYAAISFGLVLPWFIWNFFAGGQYGGRLINPNIDLRAAVSSFILNLSALIWNWLTPDLGIQASHHVRIVVIATLFALIAFLCYLVYRRLSQSSAQNSSVTALGRWSALFGLATGLYVLCYFLAYAFTIPPPGLRDRIAFPLFLTSVIAILGLMHLAVLLARPSKWVRLLPWIFTLVLIAAYLPNTISSASDLRINGGGYTSKAWRQSKMIQAIKNLPADIPIVTNEPDAVIFLTGRDSIRMSELIGRPAENPEQSYGKAVGDFGESVFRQGGALAIFPTFYWQIQPLYGKETQSRLDALTKGLVVYKRFGEKSGIYFYSPKYVP